MVIKHMGIKEFREEGYLQEVNRLFFHPRGLALEVSVDTLGNMQLSGIWDYREDEEGITFEPGLIRLDRIHTVENERLAHEETRQKLFNGSTIQPGDEE